MKKILIKSGNYVLKSTIKMPSTDIFIIGEQGVLMVPEPNILPIEGKGNEDIVCAKCDYVLAKSVNRSQILVPIKCPSCGTITYL
jgi:hypothetical protein